MKKLYKGLFLTMILFSCSVDKQNCCGLPEEFLGTFAHSLENCVTDEETEINCTERVTFLEEGKAELLIDGNDVVETHDYSFKGVTITIEPQEQTDSLILIFRIIASDTLERTDNGDLWVRNE